MNQLSSHSHIRYDGFTVGDRSPETPVPYYYLSCLLVSSVYQSLLLLWLITGKLSFFILRHALVTLLINELTETIHYCFFQGFGSL